LLLKIRVLLPGTYFQKQRLLEREEEP